MKYVLLAVPLRIGIPSLALVLGAVALARGAGAAPVASTPGQHVHAAATARITARTRTAATGCSGPLGTGAFVGGADQNFAPDIDGGILAGSGNEVCDLYSGIGAGIGNLIFFAQGTTMSSGLSFIAAGSGNVISTVSRDGLGRTGYAFIGAGVANAVTGNAQESAILAGQSNTMQSNWSAIEAGQNNQVVGDESAIAAGDTNVIGFNGADSAIGAGLNNTVSQAGSFIGAGIANTVSGGPSAIVAGSGNTVAGNAAFVGAGEYNRAAGLNAFLGAGYTNVAAGTDAVVGGGYENIAGGAHSAIPGGMNNIASGTATFAAGSGSRALHAGAFVWSDAVGGAVPLKSTGANQFLVRSSGGFALYSNASLTAGVMLRPGAGSWASLSDRAAKTNIVALDPAGVLAKVAALPVSEWSYRSEDASIRHVGPMAQDFYAAFGIGEDDRHITTIDEDGIALAAIKGLAAQVGRKDRQLRDLQAEVRRLAQRDAALEASVTALLHEHEAGRLSR